MANSIYAQLIVLLKAKAELLPPIEGLRMITKEEFRFPDESYRYRAGKRGHTLFSLRYAEGNEVFIVANISLSKGSHGAKDGENVKKTLAAVYVFDGKDTITEHFPHEKEGKSFSGTFGRTEALRNHLDSILGVSVGCESISMF
ncbi:MAG: hypothetical protein WAX81_02355 [Candidatus Moraniibacteriota bacterium]